MPNFIDYDGLKARGINFSKHQLRRKMNAGTFPKAVKLGERTLSWVAQEIEAWEKARIEARDAQRKAA